MAEKTVRIPFGDLINTPTPREQERLMLARARSAGIPMMGETFLVALERGELRIRREADRSYILTWRH